MGRRVYSFAMPCEEDWDRNLLRHRHRRPLHRPPVHPYRLHIQENHDVVQEQQQQQEEDVLVRYDGPFLGYFDRTTLRRVLHGSYYISFLFLFHGSPFLTYHFCTKLFHRPFTSSSSMSSIHFPFWISRYMANIGS